MIKKYLIIISLLLAIIFIECSNNKKGNIKQNDSTDKIIKPIDTKNLIEKKDYEAIHKSLISEFKPEIVSLDEFTNFKKKSNYINVIVDYDSKNSIEYFGGKNNEKNIHYHPLPTKINEQEYGNNKILFGDLNDDKKRDCIISVFRSDGYDEITFFYVFINYGSTFKLENVTNETVICGCIKEGWPHRFRYQIIEDGFLKGVSECHYKDAHCCPSIYLKTKVKFINGKLQFYSSAFVMDDGLEYRPTPNLDSILLKNSLKLFD